MQIKGLAKRVMRGTMTPYSVEYRKATDVEHAMRTSARHKARTSTVRYYRQPWSVAIMRLPAARNDASSVAATSLIRPGDRSKCDARCADAADANFSSPRPYTQHVRLSEAHISANCGPTNVLHVGLDMHSAYDARRSHIGCPIRRTAAVAIGSPTICPDVLYDNGDVRSPTVWAHRISFIECATAFGLLFLHNVSGCCVINRS
jgi:hypothetical protein